MEHELKAYNFFGYVNGTVACPAPNLVRTTEITVSEPDSALWKIVDSQLISATTLPLILGLDHTSQVWEVLEHRFNSISKPHVHDLKQQLYNITKTTTCEAYFDTIKGLSYKLATAVSENVDHFLDSSPKVKDKIRLALGRIILHPQYGQSLVQFWAATKIEGRLMLTTQNQPFGLHKVGRSEWGLCDYRMKSMKYKFYGDIGESGEEELGLPGRVFLYKLPESAPDVQYYSPKEYPQRRDASLCQVRASLALPVFEHSSQVCVGVLELVSAVDAIADWYDKSFLHNLYDVFQEVGLQSSDVHKHYEMKYKDEDEALTAAFDELTLVLESVCDIHKLPLALTWVPCNACDALLLGRLSSNGGEYLQPFEANDNHLVKSLISSTGYHLRKGHVAERVLKSTSITCCSDVTQFSITEYPLVPIARQCKLSGWFTVCLHSSYTGEYVYMLEFFLPASSKDNETTLTQVSTILGTMKKNSKTFKLASGKELGEVLSVEIFDFQNGQRHPYPRKIHASLELVKNGDDGMDVINAEQHDTLATISKDGTTKTQEKEHKKTGVRFDISLEDVLLFSALSRKDAAMRLKVSESTLKRICRDNGIHRWPPRGLNKKGGGAVTQLDSDQPSTDAANNGRSIIGAKSSNLDVTCSEEGSIITQERKKVKTGIRIEIPLEVVLKYSKMTLDNAARKLQVSSSTLKRVCRGYGIHRWPPRFIDNIGAPQPSHDVPPCDLDNVGAPQPSCVELQEGISQLTSDMPSHQVSGGRDYRIQKVGAPWHSNVEHQDGISQLTFDTPSNQAPLREEGNLQLAFDGPSNQVLDSVAHVKPRDTVVQDMNTKMVAVRAKYVNGFTIKFQLPLWSGLEELHQQVGKRLNLKAEAYDITYEDEDGEPILMSCDEDLQSCISTFRSLGKNPILVLLEPKKLT